MSADTLVPLWSHTWNTLRGTDPTECVSNEAVIKLTYRVSGYLVYGGCVKRQSRKAKSYSG